METRGDRHVFNSKRCKASSFHRTAAMHHKTRAKVTQLNEHFVCVLCAGYLIDATTIIECLHSFCKTCIVRYLQTCNYCPICDVQVHKTRPLQCIRQDKILQDLVYKLVPGLFKDEMKRRRDFYTTNPIEGAVIRSVDVVEDDLSTQERVIFSDDEKISLVLQLSTNGRPPGYSKSCEYNNKKSSIEQRYLLCPAGVTIAHLKKFVRLKFSLPHKFKIDMYQSDECLSDAYTLMDIAYIYTWRRRGPLKLFFTVYESTPVKRKGASVSTVAATASSPAKLAREKKHAKDTRAQETTAGLTKIAENRDWTTKSVVRAKQNSDSGNRNNDVLGIDCSSDEQSPFRDVAIPIVETTPPNSNTPCSSKDGNDGASELDGNRTIVSLAGFSEGDVTKTTQTDVKEEPMELLRVPAL